MSNLILPSKARIWLPDYQLVTPASRIVGPPSPNYLAALARRGASPSGGGGAASTVTAVSRAAGSTAGGGSVTITGSGFSGTPAVTFGGVQATNVSVTNATTLTCTVPAHAAGTVDVAVESATFTNGYEYIAAYDTVFATHGFENDLLAPFTTPTGADVSTAQAHGGTRSVLHRFTASEDEESLNYDFGNVNPAKAQTNGLWMRWFVYIPTATRTALSAGQVKLHLARINNGGSLIGGWMELGIGPEITGEVNTMALIADQVAGNPQLGSDYSYPVDTWIEIVLNYKWNTGSSNGTVRAWRGSGNSLAYWGTMTHANLGTSGDTHNQTFALGVYSQNSGSYPIDVYTDDPTLANGWIGD